MASNLSGLHLGCCILINHTVSFHFNLDQCYVFVFAEAYCWQDCWINIIENVGTVKCGINEIVRNNLSLMETMKLRSFVCERVWRRSSKLCILMTVQNGFLSFGRAQPPVHKSSLNNSRPQDRMIQLVYHVVSLNIPGPLSAVGKPVLLCQLTWNVVSLVFVLSVDAGCWFRTAGAHRRRPRHQRRGRSLERSKRTTS